MTPKEFVDLFSRERDTLLELYYDESSETEVAAILHSAQLGPDQRAIVNRAIRTVLTDAFYTVLLALDGEASLGGVQEPYSLTTRDGVQLSGELEGLAYDALQSESE